MSYILKDHQWGIFVGCDQNGVMYWSKVNPNAQDHAVAFKDLEDIKDFVSRIPGVQRRWLMACEVQPDEGAHISVAALVKQGHEGWIHELTPSANLLPL